MLIFHFIYQQVVGVHMKFKHSISLYIFVFESIFNEKSLDYISSLILTLKYKPRDAFWIPYSYTSLGRSIYPSQRQYTHVHQHIYISSVHIISYQARASTSIPKWCINIAIHSAAITPLSVLVLHLKLHIILCAHSRTSSLVPSCRDDYQKSEIELFCECSGALFQQKVIINHFVWKFTIPVPTLDFPTKLLEAEYKLFNSLLYL